MVVLIWALTVVVYVVVLAIGWRYIHVKTTDHVHRPKRGSDYYPAYCVNDDMWCTHGGFSNRLTGVVVALVTWPVGIFIFLSILGWKKTVLAPTKTQRLKATEEKNKKELEAATAALTSEDKRLLGL